MTARLRSLRWLLSMAGSHCDGATEVSVTLRDELPAPSPCTVIGVPACTVPC